MEALNDSRVYESAQQVLRMRDNSRSNWKYCFEKCYELQQLSFAQKRKQSSKSLAESPSSMGASLSQNSNEDPLTQPSPQSQQPKHPKPPPPPTRPPNLNSPPPPVSAGVFSAYHQPLTTQQTIRAYNKAIACRMMRASVACRALAALGSAQSSVSDVYRAEAYKHLASLVHDYPQAVTFEHVVNAKEKTKSFTKRSDKKRRISIKVGGWACAKCERHGEKVLSRAQGLP